MNVLVITYWSYKEPLVQAYTLPYLRIMAGLLEPGSTIFLFTLEKPGLALSAEERELRDNELRAYGIRCIERPYFRFGGRAMLGWLSNLLFLLRFSRRNAVEALHAFGSPAGTSAHTVSRITGIPYVIDSYEPHAEAMVENGSWKRRSLAFKLLIRFEKWQTRSARAVLGTTAAMREYAAKSYGYIPRVLIPRPACVDLDQFDPDAPLTIERSELGFAHDDVVCIYAGKLGGIYLKDEIFDFLAACYRNWGNRFRVIMLSDAGHDELNRQAQRTGIPLAQFHLRQVAHREVPEWLRLADFGLNPVKPVPSKRYCTSIKDGEYWAMGLPVVIPANISDDSDLVAREGIGVVLEDLTTVAYERAVDRLEALIRRSRETQNEQSAFKARIRAVAERERGMAIAHAAYARLYGPNGAMRLPIKRFLVLIYNSYADPLYSGLMHRYIAQQAHDHPNYRFDLITFEQVKYALSPKAAEDERIALSGQGIDWQPLTYHSGSFMLLKKGYDFLAVVVQVLAMQVRRRTRLVIAFANTSAAISYAISRLIRTPMLVYSFEPHSAFMAEFGTWKRSGWQYRLLHFFEQRVARRAEYILTGTRFMVDDLKDVATGEVHRAPSGVDPELYRFDSTARTALRTQLGVDERRVLVYAGKFGGIYYNGEIAEFCHALQQADARWFFVFVSPSDHAEIRALCAQAGLAEDSYHLTEVDTPNEMCAWLSAADMGLTAIPPHPHQKYRSPVKVGEYLMCGLPYITCRGVSEDDEWAEAHRVGVVLPEISREQAALALEGMNALLAEAPEELRDRCRKTGIAYRSRAKVDALFTGILSRH